MKERIEEVKNIKFNTPIDGTIGNQLGEFQRIEDKFLVPIAHKEKVIDKLFAFLELAYLDKNTKFTLIESLYFDSDNLDFFQHHFLPIETRYKMRVRRYAPDGIWSDGPALLELKRKRNGESKKTRFMISEADLHKIKRGEGILFSDEIRDINPNLKLSTLLKRIAKVNELISQYSLKPVLSVQYHRLAFEKDGFRVTIDQQLAGEECTLLDPKALNSIREIKEVWEKAQTFLEKYSNNDKFVMELKHQGSIPNWMTEIINELKLEKTGFSKYCWFIICKIKNAAALMIGH